MTTPTLPPFPKKPSTSFELHGYYSDLAAAWESRARLLYEGITSVGLGTTHWDGCEKHHWRCKLLANCGRLPPKEK